MRRRWGSLNRKRVRPGYKGNDKGGNNRVLGGGETDSHKLVHLGKWVPDQKRDGENKNRGWPVFGQLMLGNQII